MRYLLDTNTCIAIIKRAPPQVRERFLRLRVGDVAVSAVTCCELQFGVANSSRPDENQLALTGFLAPLAVLDFPSAAAPVFGRLRAGLRRAGTSIGGYDLLIAAHALFLGLVLVTNNTGEFRRVPGLEVEDWLAEAGSGAP